MRKFKKRKLPKKKKLKHFDVLGDAEDHIKTTVEANSKEELLDKIKNIEWDSIKPEDNKIGSRFDFSI